MKLLHLIGASLLCIFSGGAAVAAESTSLNGAACASTGSVVSSAGGSEGFGPGQTIICPVVVEYAWGQRKIYYAYVATTGGYSSSLINCGVRSRNNDGTSYQWKNVADITSASPLVVNSHNVTVECTNNSPGWTGAQAYVTKYNVRHTDSAGG